MARLSYMIVVLLVACGPERRPDDPNPKRPDPNEQSPSEGSDLSPALEARRQAALEELRKGNYDAGRDQLAALSSDAGPSYTVLNDLAVAEALRGDFKASLAAVNEALRLNPNGLEAAMNKIEALLQLGDRTRALELGRDTVKRHPKSAEAEVALGKANFSLGRLNEARAAFEKALDLDANNTDAALGVLAVVGQQTDTPEADEVIERTVAHAPDNPDALHLAGVAREKRMDDKGAQAYYERAIAAADAQGVAMPWAHYNLGRLLERTKGLDAARPHYQKFLENAPPSGAFEREYVEGQLAPGPKGSP